MVVSKVASCQLYESEVPLPAPRSTIPSAFALPADSFLSLSCSLLIIYPVYSQLKCSLTQCCLMTLSLLLAFLITAVSRLKPGKLIQEKGGAPPGSQMGSAARIYLEQVIAVIINPLRRSAPSGSNKKQRAAE